MVHRGSGSDIGSLPENLLLITNNLINEARDFMIIKIEFRVHFLFNLCTKLYQNENFTSSDIVLLVHFQVIFSV